MLLYVLGLSHGAVSLALEALGHPLGKTAVYEAVQAAGEKVSGLRRQSALDVSRLMAWAGSHLKLGGASLAGVVA